MIIIKKLKKSPSLIRNIHCKNNVSALRLNIIIQLIENILHDKYGHRLNTILSIQINQTQNIDLHTFTRWFKMIKLNFTKKKFLCF